MSEDRDLVWDAEEGRWVPLSHDGGHTVVDVDL